jgi:hypothetical protein
MIRTPTNTAEDPETKFVLYVAQQHSYRAECAKRPD